MQAAAAAAGFAWRTVERVKGSLGVKSEAKHKGGRTEWWWSDPVAEREAEHEQLLAALPPLELPWIPRR